MVKEFADAAFALTPGKVVEAPVKTQFGWHVIKVDDKRKVKAPKFEEVQEQLRSAVLEDSMLKLVTSLRDKAAIERFNQEENLKLVVIKKPSQKKKYLLKSKPF
jgi:peptidyl-prolyl cis-trans isomerase C